MQQLSDAERHYISKSLGSYLKDTKTTLREASARAHVDIGQISRYRNGQYKWLSPNLERLCKVAKINPKAAASVDPSKSKILIAALERVWDGSDQHASAIASTITTLRKYPT